MSKLIITRKTKSDLEKFIADQIVKDLNEAFQRGCDKDGFYIGRSAKLR